MGYTNLLLLRPPSPRQSGTGTQTSHGVTGTDQTATAARSDLLVQCDFRCHRGLEAVLGHRLGRGVGQTKREVSERFDACYPILLFD